MMQQPPQQFPRPQATSSQQLFTGDEFLIKQKKTQDGIIYYMKNEDSKTIGYVNLKTVGPDGEIKVFRDKSMTREIMVVRQVPGSSDEYLVIDVENGEVIGILKKIYVENKIKDKWEIHDKNNKKRGTIKEHGGSLKGLLYKWVHQKYDIKHLGKLVGEIIERPRDTGHRFLLDLGEDPKETIDKRLAAVCCIMISVSEQDY